MSGTPLHPVHPARWVLEQLGDCGFLVQRLLAFTRASTLVLAHDQEGAEVVVKAGFGSNHVLAELPDELRPAAYGFYWYTEMTPQERLLARADFQHEVSTVTACTGIEHVVPVLRTGTTSRFDWYSMPYFPEGNFRGLLGPAADSDGLRRRWSILGDVAAGLCGVHGVGIIHRDVYAENVLLQGGKGHITDLGASRHLAVPRGPIARGPEVHWPPEYLVDYSGATQAADVFSLGVLVYRATYGDIPRRFCGARPESLTRELSVSLDAALAPHAASRPTMSQFRDVLRRAADDQSRA